jgi:uncharacterized protein with HEPN domain
MRADAAYLRDILAACERIRKITEASAGFASDEIITAAVLHHLTVIGEAVARLPQETRDRHPQVPWRSITVVRNRIVHAYFDLDWDIIRETAVSDIPGFQRQIESILAATSSPSAD